MKAEQNSKLALVTGASRGVGRGVALALGDAGMTVVVTGRTLEGSRSVRDTADEVTRRGGRGIALRCDHANDDDVRQVFRRIEAELGRLDVLVNDMFQIPSEPMFGVPFWEQSLSLWDQMHRVGLRSHYVASVLAAPLMIPQKRGLIANISSFGGAGFQLNVAYGVGKAGVDRLARDMAHDLQTAWRDGREPVARRPAPASCEWEPRARAFGRCRASVTRLQTRSRGSGRARRGCGELPDVGLTRRPRWTRAASGR
ncbi:MAG: SDR family NAD(P)-dependent oxidoreductase [Myxococcales bacterium]|nr:SDR family NAD(P)-dependent oxidoreductase [Myxococcales bacterium]